MNHSFFADLRPVVVDQEESMVLKDLEILYKQEKRMEILVRVEFSISLAKNFGSFMLRVHAFALKMGFKIGDVFTK